MGILAIINLVATMGPSILSLISQVEGLFPAKGGGDAKKSVVMDTIHNAAVTAGHTVDEVEAIIPVASQLVDSFVGIMNVAGTWKQGNEIAAQVHGGLNKAADTAKQIKLVADAVAIQVKNDPVVPASGD